MSAPPLIITGPADLVEAVPYLLGFTPTDSLVIVGLAANTVTVTVRADLDGLTPDQITELAHTLRDKADADGGEAEAGDLEAVHHPRRVGQAGREGGGIAAERVQHGDGDPGPPLRRPSRNPGTQGVPGPARMTSSSRAVSPDRSTMPVTEVVDRRGPR